jgi:glycosyltransferase involved in cell wall biosynthesis
MRLLCISPSYWPAFQFGGPIFSMHALNKALTKKGVEVTVYTTNAGLETSVGATGEVDDIDNVRVNYFLYSKLFHFFGSTGWHFSPALSRAISEKINTFDIVYIVAVWNYPVAIAAYYCRQNKKPYIISPRGLLYPYAARKKFYKKWLYYNLIAKRDLRSAAAIHYTTEDEKRACHAFLGLKNRAFVIPNGINLDEFNNLPDRYIFRQRYPVLKEKKIILFLGRINWKKGLDILIDAYRMLTSERSDLHLVIAGNDEAGYIKKVKGWIAKFGLKDKVTLAGMLIGKDKLQAYAASDIFILPSYSENFGMTAVEAMACAKPVIISDRVGISKEVQENNAGLVVGCSANGLCQAIKLLSDNASLREALSGNAKKMVARYYNIDVIAERMLGIFKEVC